MLLKQQNLSAPGLPAIEYVYRQMHPLLQFLPQKLAEWIDKNLGDELNLSARAGSDADWSTEKLNVILQRCLVSDRKGLNIHTFQMLEFESDLYRGIMRARCYPFDAQEYRFRGHNIKVHCMPQCLRLYPLSLNTRYIPCIYLVFVWYTPDFLCLRIVWQPSLLIHFTLGIVMMATLLKMPCRIQTACG